MTWDQGKEERARAGMRNGYGDTTVKATAGAIDLKHPKVRGMLEKLSSRLLGKRVTRTNARQQRCLIHRARIGVAKASEVDQDAVRGDYLLPANQRVSSAVATARGRTCLTSRC